MHKFWVLIIAFMITPALSGCLQPEDKRTIIEEPSIFDFGRPSPANTWYHYAGTLSQPYAVDATNASVLPSEKDDIGCAPIITKALAHMSILVVAIIIKKII